MNQSPTKLVLAKLIPLLDHPKETVVMRAGSIILAHEHRLLLRQDKLKAAAAKDKRDDLNYLLESGDLDGLDDLFPSDEEYETDEADDTDEPDESDESDETDESDESDESDEAPESTSPTAASPTAVPSNCPTTHAATNREPSALPASHANTNTNTDTAPTNTQAAPAPNPYRNQRTDADAHTQVDADIVDNNNPKSPTDPARYAMAIERSFNFVRRRIKLCKIKSQRKDLGIGYIQIRQWRSIFYQYHPQFSPNRAAAK